jgi:cytochrome P450
LAARLAGYRGLCFALNHQLPLKVAFAVLRRLRPIAILRGTVIVTKDRDIREVLERFEDFTLFEILGSGMPWGPFLMTVDWREQHARERQLLQSAVCRGADQARIRKLVVNTCRTRLAQATTTYSGRRQVDVVADLAEPVAVAIAHRYFGIPPIRRDELDMARVMADLASTIMVAPPEGSARWVRSRDSIARMTRHLSELIADKTISAETARNAPPPDDLVGRLVQKLRGETTGPKWFNEDWIRRYAMGLVGTGGATIVRATTQAVDRLLAYPGAWERAQALAARLDREEHAARHASGKDQEAARLRIDASRQRLRQIVNEALRFRPMLPLLVRYSPRDTILAKGTRRARVVPAGARVIAGPLAAMFDPEAMEMPWRFWSSRPLEDYLNFGHGDRVCFGKYVAEVALTEIIRALLRLNDVRRAPGTDGRVQYDGPVARSLVLTFDPSDSTTPP